MNMNMQKKALNIITKPLSVLLIVLFFVTTVIEVDGRRRKRKYNPKKTREQALEIIRTTSKEVSQLAGIEASISDSLKLKYFEQSEDESVGEEGEDIEELEAEDDVEVDIETFNMLWLTYVGDDDQEEDFTPSGIMKSEIMSVILEWLGTPYRFGGISKKGIDCSAFTRRIFLETAEIMLPRTARTQILVGEKVKMDQLQFGDLIFFHTSPRQYVSHTGIYLGDMLFAHASSRYGVTVSSLESTYYKKRFIGGRRLSSHDLYKYSIHKSDELKKY